MQSWTLLTFLTTCKKNSSVWAGCALKNAGCVIPGMQHLKWHWQGVGRQLQGLLQLFWAEILELLCSRSQLSSGTTVLQLSSSAGWAQAPLTSPEKKQRRTGVSKFTSLKSCRVTNIPSRSAGERAKSQMGCRIPLLRRPLCLLNWGYFQVLLGQSNTPGELLQVLCCYHSSSGFCNLSYSHRMQNICCKWRGFWISLCWPTRKHGLGLDSLCIVVAALNLCLKERGAGFGCSRAHTSSCLHLLNQTLGRQLVSFGRFQLLQRKAPV